MWRRCVQMMLEVIADGALAAAANILAGALVAPDLASARLRASLADALQALGHSVSSYAGVLSVHTRSELQMRSRLAGTAHVLVPRLRRRRSPLSGRSGITPHRSLPACMLVKDPRLQPR
jgi:hypothetical protein